MQRALAFAIAQQGHRLILADGRVRRRCETGRQQQDRKHQQGF
jgi:hypothetical protein